MLPLFYYFNFSINYPNMIILFTILQILFIIADTTTSE